MAHTVMDLYDALKAAGVEEPLARKAAKAVVSADDASRLATKQDLAEMETKIIKWTLGAMAVLTAVYSAINAALKFVP